MSLTRIVDFIAYVHVYVLATGKRTREYAQNMLWKIAGNEPSQAKTSEILSNCGKFAAQWMPKDLIYTAIKAIISKQEHKVSNIYLQFTRTNLKQAIIKTLEWSYEKTDS